MKKNPMKMINMKKTMLTLALVTCAGSLLNAQTLIIDPLTDSYTPFSGNDFNDQPVSNLLGNAGLSATLATPGTTVTYTPGTLPTDSDNNGTTSGRIVFFSPGPTQTIPGVITFNLNLTSGTGGNAVGYDISGIYLYNYNEKSGTARGIQSVDILYSTNGGISYTNFGLVTGFNQAIGNNQNDPGQEVDLGTTLTGVTNIEFTGGSNFGDPTFIGAEKVRFLGTDTVASVPEPNAYAMMLGGFGVLIALQGMRKRQA